MPKKMPGFQDYTDKLSAVQKAIEKKRLAEEKKKTDEAEKKKQAKIKKAQEKLERKLYDKKVRIVNKGQKKAYPTYGSRTLSAFLVGQIVGITLGTIFGYGSDRLSDGEYDYDTNTFYFAQYDSWADAFKDAYGVEGITGPFIVNLLITIISLSLGVAGEFNLKKQRKQEAKKTLSIIEKLKSANVEVAEIIEKLKPTTDKMLESLSKIDRGYFDNLVSGGLDKAGYEICVAIVSGYLKSHPKEYNKIIAIIDEATLSEAIKKKYSKGKIISFGAAKAMQAVK